MLQAVELAVTLDEWSALSLYRMRPTAGRHSRFQVVPEVRARARVRGRPHRA